MKIAIFDKDYKYLLNLAGKLSFLCPREEFSVFNEQKKLVYDLETRNIDLLIAATNPALPAETLEHCETLKLYKERPGGFIENLADGFSTCAKCNDGSDTNGSGCYSNLTCAANAIEATDLVQEINPYYCTDFSRYTPPKRIAEFILNRAANHPDRINTVGKMIGLLAPPCDNTQAVSAVNKLVAQYSTLGLKLLILPFCPQLLFPLPWLNTINGHHLNGNSTADEKVNVSSVEASTNISADFDDKPTLSELIKAINIENGDVNSMFKQSEIELTPNVRLLLPFRRYDDLINLQTEECTSLIVAFKEFVRISEPFTVGIIYMCGLSPASTAACLNLTGTTQIISPTIPAFNHVWQLEVKDIMEISPELKTKTTHLPIIDL